MKRHPQLVPVRRAFCSLKGRRRSGMTLIETAIVISLVSAALFLLAGWMGRLREDTKRELAIRVLARLDQALSRYHRATGSHPVPPSPESAIQATVYLMNFDKTRPLLESLPASVWRGPGRRTLVDPWGTPLRYLSPKDDSAYVRANEGRPLFISAGPDRDFGDDDRTAVGDNLRSDDPGPDGFRPR